MGFVPKVERWRSMVGRELQRINVPIPPETVLSLITAESGGQPGIVNQSSGASGLGQFKPIAVREYNRFHAADPLTMADMRDTSDRGAKLQIRATVWLMSHNWRMTNSYLRGRGLQSVPIDQLVKIADLFYGAGPGATKKRMKNRPPTFESIKSLEPSWWAIGHAEKVWGLAERNNVHWDLARIDAWLGSGDISDPDPDPIPDQNEDTGVIIAVLIIAFGWYLLKRGDK